MKSTVTAIYIKNKKVYGYLLLGSIIVTAVITLFLKNEYRAEASLVAPRASLALSGSGVSSGSSGSPLSSLLPSFLSSSNYDPNVEYAIQVASSYAFLSKFIAEQDLLPELLAFKSYSASRNEITLKKNADQLRLKNLFKDREIDLESIEFQEGVKAFRKKFSIYADIESTLVTAQFTYYSPYLARDILEQLLIDISKTIAAKDVINAERNIDYIAQKINSYPQSVITKTLGAVLESNITKMVLAQSDAEYAFSTIDAPILPLKKFWPSRTFIVLSSFLSMILVIIISIFIELQYTLRVLNPSDTLAKK
jgi:uncharacterized protein involved in exopolysaccharide biosynthesis